MNEFYIALLTLHGLGVVFLSCAFSVILANDGSGAFAGYRPIWLILGLLFWPLPVTLLAIRNCGWLFRKIED